MSDTPETPLSDAERFDAAVSQRRESAPGPIENAEPAATAAPAEPEANIAAPGSDEFDPATLPPAARARWDKLNNDYAQANRDRLAALGRVTPAQREVAELKRQLASLQPASATTPGTAAAPNAAPLPGSPKWEQFQRAFPEDAAAILELDQVRERELAELRKEVAEFKKFAPQMEQVGQFIQRDAQTRVQTEVLEAHPDWMDLVFGSNPTSRVDIGLGQPVDLQFAEWLSSQHPSVQSLAHSDAAADNIYLFDQYKRDLQIADRLSATPEPSQPAEVSPEAAAAAKAHERRTQNRAASVAPNLRGQAPVAARADLSQMSDADRFDITVAARRLAQQRNAKRQQG